MPSEFAFEHPLGLLGVLGVELDVARRERSGDEVGSGLCAQGHLHEDAHRRCKHAPPWHCLSAWTTGPPTPPRDAEHAT